MSLFWKQRWYPKKGAIYWAGLLWHMLRTEVSFPVGSLRFKMSSSHWIKTQIFTKLMKSDGHLSMLTFWFSWCACQMELTTSFQSKSAKFETFLQFFFNQVSSWCSSCEKRGGKRGKAQTVQWDSENVTILHLAFIFDLLQPFAALWRIFDQGL